MSLASSVHQRKLASSPPRGRGVEGERCFSPLGFLFNTVQERDERPTPCSKLQPPTEAEEWPSVKTKGEPSRTGLSGTVCSALAEVPGFCSGSPMSDFRPSINSYFKQVDPTKVFPSAAKSDTSISAGAQLGVHKPRMTNQFLSPLVRTNLFAEAAHPYSKITVSPVIESGHASFPPQLQKGRKMHVFKPIGPSPLSESALPLVARESRQVDVLLGKNQRESSEPSISARHHLDASASACAHAKAGNAAPDLPMVSSWSSASTRASPASTTNGKTEKIGSIIGRKTEGLTVVLVPQPQLGAEERSIQHPSASPRRFSRWSQQEDELLIHAVKSNGGPPVSWKSISREYFRGRRNENQCKGRWKKHLRPDVKRTAWTKEEEELLVKYQKDGLTWTQIALKLDGRSSEQVRERFCNHADPSLNREPFTNEERRILYEEQRKIGNKWTEIAKLLPGRSENQVKNCWHNAKMAQRRKLGRLANVTLQPKKRRKKNGDASNSSKGDEESTNPEVGGFEVLPRYPLPSKHGDVVETAEV